MIPSIETFSSEDIQKFQEEKLRGLLIYLQQTSPFYQKYFNNHRIEVSAIQTLKDLTTIPPTTKDDLQQFNQYFFCVAGSRIIDYTSTSGTLGKPVIVPLSEKDLQRLAFNESLSFECAGITENDVVQLMLTLDRQFMAGIAYFEGLRKLGAGIIRTGPALPSAQLDLIQQLKPTALVAVPSFLLKVIEYAAQKNISLSQTSVKKIICIGENIRTPNFQLNALGRRIASAWDVPMYSTYASTEMQTAFTECAEGHGGHHHPGLIIIEVLDENNNQVEVGGAGELTITTLDVEAMPLLRYKTGDIVRLNAGPCACGRTTLRISPVLGRKQQMIKLKGTTIYPQGISDILHEQSTLQDFVIEISSSDVDTDHIRLYLLLNSADQAHARATLEKEFQARLRVTPEINFCTVKELEGMQFIPGARKPSRLIDKRVQ